MLKPLNLNLLSWLVIAIVLLGVISAVTVFMNAQTYRDLAFNFQRQYMSQLIESEVTEILAEQAGIAYHMGQNIRKDADFSGAFETGDNGVLRGVLEAQYHSAPVTSGLIDVVGIYVFDADYRLRAATMRYPALPGEGELMCAGLVEGMQLPGAGVRPGPLDEFCLHEGDTYIAAIVSLGDLKPTGFLQLVYNPLAGIGRLDERLGMPVQITGLQGDAVVTSPDWAALTSGNFVRSDYMLKSRAGEPVLEIVAASNADELILKIDKTNKRLMIIVALVLLVSVGLALLILKYSVFKPLQRLSHQLKSRWVQGSGSTHEPTAADKKRTVTFHALGELY
ncbi:MAG: hypothetical protein HKP57_02835, partial [Halobacteria archaeon]|nr:hypothetical protein [Halobacteria archaeon]